MPAPGASFFGAIVMDETDPAQQITARIDRDTDSAILVLHSEAVCAEGTDRMSSSTIWIAYDLGVRGDYEGLYAWLDQHKAKECADSLALLSYSHSGALVDALKADLGESVEINKRTRVYVIYRDDRTNTMKGHFLFGGRRAPPWTGASGQGQEMDDES
jgi:hypothetical protein